MSSWSSERYVQQPNTNTANAGIIRIGKIRLRIPTTMDALASILNECDSFVYMGTTSRGTWVAVHQRGEWNLYLAGDA
jgi:hypothetical protein